MVFVLLIITGCTNTAELNVLPAWYGKPSGNNEMIFGYGNHHDLSAAKNYALADVAHQLKSRVVAYVSREVNTGRSYIEESKSYVSVQSETFDFINTPVVKHDEYSGKHFVQVVLSKSHLFSSIRREVAAEKQRFSWVNSTKINLADRVRFLKTDQLANAMFLSGLLAQLTSAPQDINTFKQLAATRDDYAENISRICVLTEKSTWVEQYLLSTFSQLGFKLSSDDIATDCYLLKVEKTHDFSKKRATYIATSTINVRFIKSNRNVLTLSDFAVGQSEMSFKDAMRQATQKAIQSAVKTI